MAAPTFEDKEDVRKTTLPRKNTVVADDINQLKAGIVDLYDNLPPIRAYSIYVARVQANATGGASVVSEYNEIGGKGYIEESGLGQYTFFITGVTNPFSGALIETFINIGINQVNGEFFADFIESSSNEMLINIYDVSGNPVYGFEGTIRIHVWPTITP